MPRPLPCEYCRAALDLAQQFAYHVESESAGDPKQPGLPRRLPWAGGRPLRVCRRCQSAFVNRKAAPDRADIDGRALLAAFAVVVAWAAAAKLSRWLTDGPA